MAENMYAFTNLLLTSPRPTHNQPWATAFLLSAFMGLTFLLLLLLFFLDSTYKLYLKLIIKNIKSLEPVP